MCPKHSNSVKRKHYLWEKNLSGLITFLNLFHLQFWIFYGILVRKGFGKLSRNVLSLDRIVSKPQERVKDPAFYLTSQ